LQDSDNEPEPDQAVSEGTEGLSTTVKKLTKKERKKLKEQQIRDAETALADSTVDLKTEEDYERVILSSPNSSMCWIQFMAHYLQQGEITKAKEVGMRALQTILFREEQERFNVWVALLNLENTHGTPESLAAVLQEAKQNNDDYKIMSTMAQIFCQSKKLEEAEDIYQKMVKKYRDTPDSCIKYGKFLYINKRFEDARDLFKKTLECIDRAHHVQLISKYSQFELELGEKERGCTLFDQLLGTYPKRIDIWLVYANTLAKIEDYENAKNVLIRAIEIRFPPKKSKPLFARLFEIDRKCPHPDPDAIRQLALDYASNVVV
jgi:rRNA biogenesis protein RRP5